MTPYTPRILIVEDDPSTGEVMTLAIEQETSYHAALVTTGQEALELVQDFKPDLIILDYRLPDTTGVALYDHFQTQQHLKNIPTILMSATKRTSEIEKRDVFLMDKPFELDEFLSTLEQFLKYPHHSC